MATPSKNSQNALPLPASLPNHDFFTGDLFSYLDKIACSPGIDRQLNPIGSFDSYLNNFIPCEGNEIASADVQNFQGHMNEISSVSMQSVQVDRLSSFPNRKETLNEIDTTLSAPDFMDPEFVNANESSRMTTNGINERCSNDERDNFLTGNAVGGPSQSNPVKGLWTSEEDGLLINLVKNHPDKKWSKIAERLGTRTGKQCRDRWNNHLHPGINRKLFTEEEDRILIEAHKQFGNKWTKIARRLPGRTENSIKNHWNTTKRRKSSDARLRHPRHSLASTLLWDYIKNLDSDRGTGTSRNI